jgi:hypothetical protein
MDSLTHDRIAIVESIEKSFDCYRTEAKSGSLEPRRDLFRCSICSASMDLMPTWLAICRLVKKLRGTIRRCSCI